MPAFMLHRCQEGSYAWDGHGICCIVRGSVDWCFQMKIGDLPRKHTYNLPKKRPNPKKRLNKIYERNKETIEIDELVG